MTRKRDLKKRIRDRQAKTGESYTTARRHVLAARDTDATNDRDADDVDATTKEIPSEPESFDMDLTKETGVRPRDLVGASDSRLEAEWRGLATPTSGAIQVDEVIDVSDVAGEVGLACKVLIYERLAKSVEPRLAVIAVRDALAATKSDPTTAILRAVAAGQLAKVRGRVVARDAEFMERIRAGLTAVSNDGRMIAVHVNGHQGMVTVVCAAWRHAKTLIMTTVDDRVGAVVAGIGATVGDSLFLVFNGRRYPVTREPFVIGRQKTCDLQIKDGNISRRHAAITYRQGAFYIVDLDSLAGVEYRGMKVRNKRIEEGDMFALALNYVLRFTFHETDA
jgi:hypothetical protein